MALPQQSHSIPTSPGRSRLLLTLVLVVLAASCATETARPTARAWTESALPVLQEIADQVNTLNPVFAVTDPAAIPSGLTAACATITERVPGWSEALTPAPTAEADQARNDLFDALAATCAAIALGNLETASASLQTAQAAYPILFRAAG